MQLLTYLILMRNIKNKYTINVDLEIGLRNNNI